MEKTYKGLINANTSEVLGQYHKNFVNRERSKYLEYIKNNFGEDIADAMEDAISIHLGKGLNGQFADLVVDFSGLELTDIQKEKITKSYDTFYSELLAKQKTAMSEFNSQNSEFSNNALFWLEDLSFYKDSDKYIQTAMQNIVRHIDWSSYSSEELDYDGVKRILQDSILTPFQVACDDPDTKKSLDEALKSLFTIDTTNMSIDDAANLVNQYIRTISSILNEDQLELKVRLGFDDIDALEDNYLTMLNEVATRVSGIDFSDPFFEPRNVTDEQLSIYSEIYQKIDEFAEQYSINTQDEIAAFRKALDEANYDIDKAFEKYLANLDDKVANETPDLTASISQLIDQLNTQLKPAFDSLKSAYQYIFADNKFNPNAVDIPMLDKIKSEIEELNNLENVDININMDDFDTFAKILTDVNTTKEQAQQAFDDLATSIFNATGATEGMTDETVQLVEQLLESLGVVNAHEVAQQALNKAKAQAVIASYDLIEASEDEYVAILNEAVAAGTTRQEIYRLIAAEIAFGNNDLSVEQKISKLQELARAYGDTATDAMATAISKDLASGNTDADTAINDLMTKLNAGLSKVDIDFSGIDKSASKAGSSAGKAFTDALDKELNELDKRMEAGYIDFNDYIQARLGLIEDYYRKGKLSADEYYSYLEKHYKQELSYMDKVINAVTRRIDKEIDGLEKQKDDIKSYYQLQIDSLEKEKTLLEDANKERQRQMDLQKALYEMERARNQRTILQYSSEKGMHYVADDKAIRDTQEDVDKAKYEIQISEIEKSISKLEESRDKETDAIDEMIDKLEDYKDAWQDITSAYVEAQEDLLAAQFFGADWETDIINGRLDTLNDFKNQYISIQQTMANAAWQSANEQIKAAQEAEKGASGTPSSAVTINTNDNVSTSGGGGSIGLRELGNRIHKNLELTHFYASGTNNAKKGLNLVGEDGDEVYFDNDGHVGIVTEPTLIPMEGGEVVKNERDTKKLLDPDNIKPVGNIGLADIDGKEAEYTIKVNIETNGEIPDVKSVTQPKDSSITLADGTVLTPIQPGDPIFDMQQKFDALIAKMGGDINSVLAPVNTIQKDMERMVNSISTANNVSNNRNQQVEIKEIKMIFPGVTSQEVAKQVGVEVNNLFNGLHLDAMQESMKR